MEIRGQWGHSGTNKINWIRLYAVFSIRKSLRVLQKARVKIVARAVYTYLFFFLYILYTPVLQQNKKFLCRPSQIVCTVTTMNVTCTQAALRVHENPCTVLILLCWNYLNLPVCPSFFFFLPCAWMILSCSTSCEGHKLWKLSTVYWCYQPVTNENYFSPTHTDHYVLRK